MHRFQAWRDQLYLAADERAVEKLMGEYVEALGEPLLATLPAEGRKVLATSTADIQSAAVTLLHLEMAYRGTPEIGQLLHEIAHTFAAASVRISQVRGRAEPTLPK